MKIKEYSLPWVSMVTESPAVTPKAFAEGAARLTCPLWVGEVGVKPGCTPKTATAARVPPASARVWVMPIGCAEVTPSVAAHAAACFSVTVSHIHSLILP
jgi:hypothetical protein